ncbi:MAG: ice-binding family protein [Polyangiales bacterium]
MFGKTRTRFALFAPFAAFVAVSGFSAVYASGCGGTDTIDDDAAPADSATAETDGTDTTAPDADALDDTDATVEGDAKADVIDAFDAPGSDASDATLVDAPDAVGDTLLDSPDTKFDVADAPEVGDTSDASSKVVPSLGAAADFSVLGGSTVTSTGLTSVNGNLGVWPGLAVTGFPPGVVIGGTIDKGGPTSAAGQASLTTAYDALKGAACDTDLSSVDLSGKTLGPGVYCFSSSAAIGAVGTLTLDAKGDPNAFWIFQIGSTFTTSDGSAVLVINGGSACNVFWQVGSSATIAKTNQFGGNIVAFSSITVMTGSKVSGRVLARNGAVSLDDNAVAFSTCGGGVTSDAGPDASDDASDASDASETAIDAGDTSVVDAAEAG